MASILGFLPVSNSFLISFEKFIFSHFLPNTGDFFYQQFKVSLHHAQKLSWMGFSSLFLTGFITVKTLEQHINEMWHIKEHRSISRAIWVYICFMLFGPVLVASLLILQIAAKTYLKSELSLIIHPVSYVIGILLYVFIYWLIPATKVSFRNALIAGFIGGTLFEIAKVIFVFYISRVALYDLLYGSLSVMPIFLIWVYICSLILFLCAQIVYVLENKE